jgi:hypothetical protein
MNKSRSGSESWNESIRVVRADMDKSCDHSLKTCGYHNAKDTIDSSDSAGLAKVIEDLFEARKGNSERTHWENGTQRLCLCMTEQHFSDLAEQSYREHTIDKDKVDTPYKFVESLVVWASELTPDAVDTVIRVIRATSKRVGAKWTQSFEAVRTGTSGNTSPQMWHFDGTYSCIAAVGVLPKPGIKDAVAVRGSTEFVRYEHKRLKEFDTDKKKIDYLRTIWNRIKRVRTTTQRQHDLATRQEEIEEELTIGNELVRWEASIGAMSVFFSDHLHRGASSNGIGYAYFCAWEVDHNKDGMHTDGEPVQYTNWERLYTKAFKEQADVVEAKGKGEKNDERTARVCKRSGSDE